MGILLEKWGLVQRTLTGCIIRISVRPRVALSFFFVLFFRAVGARVVPAVYCKFQTIVQLIFQLISVGLFEVIHRLYLFFECICSTSHPFLLQNSSACLLSTTLIILKFWTKSCRFKKASLDPYIGPPTTYIPLPLRNDMPVFFLAQLICLYLILFTFIFNLFTSNSPLFFSFPLFYLTFSPFFHPPFSMPLSPSDIG